MAPKQRTQTATGETRDPHAPTGVDLDAVEIKVTIRADQEGLAERVLALDGDAAEERIIYFYDTPDLALFDAGVVLRARLVKGDDDDSTVKFRPVGAGDIPEEWRKTKGFKLEADCVGDQVVCSASITVPQQRDEIDEVAAGKRPIGKLFSKEQERFFGELHKNPVDVDRLNVLGPIRVLRWKLEPEGFPHALTVEEWRLPDGDDLVEVSIKTAPEAAQGAREAFDQYLRALGLDPEGAQQTKTRTALKYFARASRPAKSSQQDD